MHTHSLTDIVCGAGPAVGSAGTRKGLYKFSYPDPHSAQKAVVMFLKVVYHPLLDDRKKEYKESVNENSCRFLSSRAIFIFLIYMILFWIVCPSSPRCLITTFQNFFIFYTNLCLDKKINLLYCVVKGQGHCDVINL